MLSDKQKQVVENFTDNILLLARAGAGKTYTLAHKIAEALSRGIKPEEILAVTFTVKAAEEIKEDAMKYSGNDEVKVFTIHGFCYSLIKEFVKATRAFKEPTVADEIDSGEVALDVLLSAKEREEYKPISDTPILSPKDVFKIISALKHERHVLGYDWFTSGGYKEAFYKLLTKRDFVSDFTAKISGVKVTDYALIDYLKAHADDFMEKYSELLHSSALMDFDDLIFCADAILKRGYIPTDRYKLVILDEMQDTSETEYLVMRRFFGSAKVLLCGDEFQTIYAWRGSSPMRIIKDYKTTFKAVTVFLDKNRRSSENISKACEYYLAKTFGYNADNRPIAPFLTENSDIEVIGANGYEDEARVVFNKIKDYGGKNSDICVMARSNRYIASLCDKLQKINSGLPKEERIRFFTVDGDFQFYKKPVVKDFLAFLRILLNPDDLPSMERVAVKYLKGVGRAFIGNVKDLGTIGLSLGAFFTGDAQKYSDNFYTLLKAYEENEIVVYDLETTGLDVEKDEFIQISAVKFGKSGKIGELNLFAMPNVEMKEEAEKVHGYGLEKLKEMGAIDQRTALRKFSEFSSSCVLVGHNSSAFDDLILNREAKTFGVEIASSGYCDTLKIASLYCPYLKDRKLSTLCEKFNVTNERAHDAFSDVLTTAEILKIFIGKYIIPTAFARRKFIDEHKAKFDSFYADYRTMEGFLDKNDLLNLFKFIGENEGVIKGKNEKEREAVNELYLALKCAMDRSETLKGTIRNFLSDAVLSGSQIDVMIKKADKIPLITIHQSKGSEFDEVILVGADENEIPSYSARLSGDDEEEKRVFYVALSRAKRKFIATYSKQITRGDKIYERKPSPYIENLPIII